MGGSPKTIHCKEIRLLLMIVLILMSTSDEHQRRSPDCVFFALSTLVNPKGGRSKKGRASKASRMSTQSNFTSVSEGVSVADTDVQGDDNTMPIVEPTPTAKSEKGAKKGTKARKPAARSKRQASKAEEENTQVATSFLEPEDDDFEVKVENPVPQSKGNKKRKSDSMSTADTAFNHEGAHSQEEIAADQPRKRRTTRSRESMAQRHDAPNSPPQGEYNGDAQRTDEEEIPPPAPPQGRKKGKGGNKRGSSNVRKASIASAASKASLRAILPPDEEIDAGLEAELDRPLTDDEGDIEPPIVKKPLGRRLTRTKPGSKKATASVAPTRRTTRASTVAAEDSTMQDVYPSLPKSTAEAHVPTPTKNEEAIIVPDSPDQSLPEHQKEQPLHKNSERVAEYDKTQNSKDAIASADIDMDEDTPTIEPQRERSRQVSRQNTRIPDLARSSGAADLASDMNSSTLAMQGAEDKLGHETDASAVKQAATKRGSKKALAKETKGGKKAAVMTRNVEVIVQRTMDDVPPEEQHSDIDLVETQVDSVVSSSAEVTEPKKSRKPSKAMAKLGKTKETVPEPEALTREASVAPLVDQPNAPAETGIARPSKHPESTHSTPRSASSPQSSDAENRPPSSCLSKPDPPPSMQSPLKSQTSRVPLAVTTPVKSPSKNNISKLQTNFPWTAVEVEHIFAGTPSSDKENTLLTSGEAGKGVDDLLTSPEKKLTVEQWIQFNAKRGEEKLRNECERLVGRFEDQGVRALRVLEGIVCSERPR